MHPCSEAIGVTIRVSSPRYWCPLARKLQADTRGSGLYSVCRLQHIPDWERWLKFSRCGEHYSTATRQIRWPRVDPVAWRESQEMQGPTDQSRSSPTMAKSTKRIAFSVDQPSTLRLPVQRFFRYIFSDVMQMPVYTMQSRGTACIPSPRHSGFTWTPDKRRIPPVCDRASLSS